MIDEGINIGERIVIGCWARFPAKVVRIYWEDSKGEETEFLALRALTMLKVEWNVNGDISYSRVKLHEEGKTWYRFAGTN